jgi:hypothetical protein
MSKLRSPGGKAGRIEVSRCLRHRTLLDMSILQGGMDHSFSTIVGVTDMTATIGALRANFTTSVDDQA